MNQASGAESEGAAEPVWRQPVLLRVGDPLTARFGAGFFRTLPEAPGVYFFRDAHGALLYVGQSGNLRGRVGSYRHVSAERHPRRTLRLVARVAEIEWEVCGTAAEAVAREAALLLEHRPPFNRAGVWKGAPWWLGLRREGQLRELRVAGEAADLGPFRPALRHALPSLLRCVLRTVEPQRALGAFPKGWFQRRAPRLWTVALPPAAAERFEERLRAFLTVGECAWLEPLWLNEDSSLEAEFWRQESQYLAEWALRVMSQAALVK